MATRTCCLPVWTCSLRLQGRRACKGQSLSDLSSAGSTTSTSERPELDGVLPPYRFFAKSHRVSSPTGPATLGSDPLMAPPAGWT